jgi:hypothetical protein
MLMRGDERASAFMRKPAGFVIALVCFGAITAFYHDNWYRPGRMADYPQHIHAWSQTDRYAIALGFLDHGFNIFIPHTYVLNPEFPPGRPLHQPEGITQVDFPLHEWIIAWIMHAANNRKPEVFRLYMLVLSTIGLWFLLMTGRRLSGSLTVGLMAVVLAQSTPVWAYYAIGFIPSIPALSTAFIGLWFLARYCRRIERGREFMWAVFFFTLSALVRFPFVILLLALVPFMIYETHRARKFLIEWRWWAAGLLAVLAYFIYNSWLASQFGSVFLREPVSLGSFSAQMEVLGKAWTQWGSDWLTDHHFWLFVFLFPAVLFVLFLRRFQRVSPFFLFGATALVGGAAYVWLMLPKFEHHDYYFLDSLFLPAIALSVSALAFLIRQYTWIWMAFIPLLLYLVIETNVSVKRSLHQRYTDTFWNDTPDCHADFGMSVNWLNGLIKPEEKPIVWAACAPNIPFVHLNRPGFQYMYLNPQIIKQTLSEDRFIICRNQDFGAEVFPYLSETEVGIKLLATNNKIALYFLNMSSANKAKLPELLGYQPKFDIFRPDTGSVHMADTMQFYELFKATPEEGITDGFQICMRIKEAAVGDATLFCSITCEGRLLYYRGRPLSAKYHSFSLPETSRGCELNVYVMKTENQAIDFEVADFKIFKVPVVHGRQQHLR